jgi:uncharacterized repeat protein (TIGR02543 family)
MGFAGIASTVTPAGPVPAGTLVQAYVGDELRGETTTKAGGAYDNLLVSGPGPGTVTFRVAGVLAQESIVWAGGELKYDFNLTVPSLPGTSYSLTMAVSPAGTGNATDVTNASPYAAGVQVSIQAVAAPGYRFVNWTAPAGSFTNASSATTTFTMPSQDVTVTASFEAGGAYTLTMAASPIMGGTAYDVTGASPYSEGEVVSIQAVAASGYQFAGWAAPAGSFANAYASATTFTRGFRDGVLLESAAGSQLVALYYRLSPCIADFISGNSLLRTLVRELLVDPVVWVVGAAGDIWRN